MEASGDIVGGGDRCTRGKDGQRERKLQDYTACIMMIELISFSTGAYPTSLHSIDHV